MRQFYIFERKGADEAWLMKPSLIYYTKKIVMQA